MSDIQQIYENPSLVDDPDYSDDQQEELAQYNHDMSGGEDSDISDTDSVGPAPKIIKKMINKDDDNDNDDDEDDEDEDEDDDKQYFEDVEELSSDEDDDEEDDDFKYKKLDKEDNKYLLNYHPETKQLNYKEILTLSNVIRDENGEVIDPLHRTFPILSKYEKTRILGIRAKQLANGSEPFVSINKEIILPHIIAEMELKEKKIPFIIRRPMPNNNSEYWKISDLELVN